MRFNFRFIAAIVLLCAFISPSGVNAQEATSLDIVILGDSNIWLAGDSCNNHKGWAAWFKDFVNPASMVSYARSGASWCHTGRTKINPEEDIAVLGDDNVICNQVVRLIDAYASGLQKEPDVLMIAAGGNDAWFYDKRPEEFSLTPEDVMTISADVLAAMQPSDVLSLPGAIRYDVLTLRGAFPDAKIIFLTSTPMVKVEPEMMTKVCDIIERTGQWLDIPTIRLDLDGPVSRDVEMTAHVNTYDGVHTNEVGAERVGTYVAQKIRPLLPQK